MKQKKESAKRRPNALGNEPVVSTKGDVNLALLEIGWLNEREASVRTAAAADRLAIEKLEKSRLAIKVDGKVTSTEDRRELLKSLIEKWLADNPSEIEGRTLKLANGKITAREQGTAIENLPGDDGHPIKDDIVLSAMNDVMRYTQDAIEMLIAPFPLLDGGEGVTLNRGDFVRLTPSVNRARLLELFNGGKIDREMLNQFLLNPRPGFDKYTITPA